MYVCVCVSICICSPGGWSYFSEATGPSVLKKPSLLLGKSSPTLPHRPASPPPQCVMCSIGKIPPLPATIIYSTWHGILQLFQALERIIWHFLTRMRSRLVIHFLPILNAKILLNQGYHGNTVFTVFPEHWKFSPNFCKSEICCVCLGGISPKCWVGSLITSASYVGGCIIP